MSSENKGRCAACPCRSQSGEPRASAVRGADRGVGRDSAEACWGQLPPRRPAAAVAQRKTRAPRALNEICSVFAPPPGRGSRVRMKASNLVHAHRQRGACGAVPRTRRNAWLLQRIGQTKEEGTRAKVQPRLKCQLLGWAQVADALTA